ncbi:hypothetical protein IE53DRAFT_13670 [Violaceomyces palustris]|uniref:Uncharacterized protein n=1 Tax=Violaceomyces palustris TaxID=1673888 RepID=A0ACD0P2G7_9BASI|nr:hypothetical protein IE53DRAFT_13670 [Violaceomyces palustris]
MMTAGIRLETFVALLLLLPLLSTWSQAMTIATDPNASQQPQPQQLYRSPPPELPTQPVRPISPFPFPSITSLKGEGTNGYPHFFLSSYAATQQQQRREGESQEEWESWIKLVSSCQSFCSVQARRRPIRSSAYTPPPRLGKRRPGGGGGANTASSAPTSLGLGLEERYHLVILGENPYLPLKAGWEGMMEPGCRIAETEWEAKGPKGGGRCLCCFCSPRYYHDPYCDRVVPREKEVEGSHSGDLEREEKEDKAMETMESIKKAKETLLDPMDDLFNLERILL